MGDKNPPIFLLLVLSMQHAVKIESHKSGQECVNYIASHLQFQQSIVIMILRLIEGVQNFFCYSSESIICISSKMKGVCLLALNNNFQVPIPWWCNFLFPALLKLQRKDVWISPISGISGPIKDLRQMYIYMCIKVFSFSAPLNWIEAGMHAGRKIYERCRIEFFSWNI